MIITTVVAIYICIYRYMYIMIFVINPNFELTQSLSILDSVSDNAEFFSNQNHYKRKYINERI